MRLFAIGDLHMPGGNDKPMDVFGSHWDRHFFHISENWRRLITPEDTVLIPGDISWAMNLADVVPDLEDIGKLPGRKIICKGNHDYWWSSASRVRSMLPVGMYALQHDAMDLGPCVVCGTRGWAFPTERTPLSDQDMKICNREIQRLNLALDDAERIAPGKPVIVMLHYPPLLQNEQQTVFTDTLEARGSVRCVVYGHLHGESFRYSFSGEKGGIRYEAVSCDGIQFCPKEIFQP